MVVRTHHRGTWDICCRERNMPERSKAAVWAQIPLQHPTCVWKCWAQSCRVPRHRRDCKSPTLNTHIELFVPKERKWCHMLRVVCESGNVLCWGEPEPWLAGWLAEWKPACKGPGDSSWAQVMWNQVGHGWHSLQGGCFWGHGALARWIWMGKSLYCLSSLLWPEGERRHCSQVQTCLWVCSAQRLLVILQGEQENCCVHEVQHITAHDDSGDAVHV